MDLTIPGDGPKRIFVEDHSLQIRVVMLGELKHTEARECLFLNGDIFQNTSIMEVIYIAIGETVG